MVWIGKILLSSLIISFVSWLSKKNTSLAGFLTALPLATLLSLAFSQFEWKDSAQSVEYAKSIFIAIPASLLFFVPFLLAKKLELSFWSCYLSGIVLLGVGYFIHKAVVNYL